MSQTCFEFRDDDEISVISEDISEESETNRSLRRISEPRVNSKLAVLGVEELICDVLTTNKEAFTRPYLHPFLTELYEDYDIILWSDRNMEELERALNLLEVREQTGYKLLAYIDRTEQISIQIPTGQAFMKPLQSVWREYPIYNNTNTVICDGRPDRIAWNIRNGILVSPYFHQCRENDQELLKLSAYLKDISKCDNLSAIDHGNWKSHICASRKKKCNCNLL